MIQRSSLFSTTAAEIRLALRTASESEAPSFLSAITAPMWASPAPVASICFALLDGRNNPFPFSRQYAPSLPRVITISCPVNLLMDCAACSAVVSPDSMKASASFKCTTG